MNNAGTASRRSPALRAGVFFSLAATLALGASPGRTSAQAAPPEKETATASWAVREWPDRPARRTLDRGEVQARINEIKRELRLI